MQAYLSYWSAWFGTPPDHIPPKQIFWDSPVIASDRVQAQCCLDSSLFSWPPFWLLAPAIAETTVVVCITDCILWTQLARRGGSQRCSRFTSWTGRLSRTAQVYRCGSPVDARGSPSAHRAATVTLTREYLERAKEPSVRFRFHTVPTSYS